MKKVGVALGGGGVRGLAHILALETIDDCGVEPCVLAGTSMGAIIGALYASGQSGRQIMDNMKKHMVSRNDSLKDVIEKKTYLMKWLHAVRVETGRGGILKVDGFLRFLLDEIRATTFEELKIPLHVVTTDFWTGEEVVFNSGPLLPAIKASMSIPGVFAPVVFDGRVLVDGGVVNNVPYDLLIGRCDCTVAIDVAPARRPGKNPIPNVVESVCGMFDILAGNAMAAKMKISSPTIYFHPDAGDFTPLAFDKTETVLQQAEPGMWKLREELMRVTG